MTGASPGSARRILRIRVLLEFGIQERQNFGIYLNILRMEFKDLESNWKIFFRGSKYMQESKNKRDRQTGLSCMSLSDISYRQVAKDQNAQIHDIVGRSRLNSMSVRHLNDYNKNNCVQVPI